MERGLCSEAARSVQHLRRTLEQKAAATATSLGMCEAYVTARDFASELLALLQMVRTSLERGRETSTAMRCELEKQSPHGGL